MDWAQSLAGLQQFLMERQMANEQAQQTMDQPTPGANPGFGGTTNPMMGQLMALAMQQGGKGKGGTGGFSGSKTGHLVTEHGVTGNARAMSMLDRVAQQYPQLWPHVISDYRTRAEQQRLYNSYKAGTGNLAAPPGHSMHEKGLAFDIDASWINSRPGLRDLLNRLGGFPVGGEPWHWQPRWTI
jgi:hypothetical protein